MELWSSFRNRLRQHRDDYVVFGVLGASLCINIALALVIVNNKRAHPEPGPKLTSGKQVPSLSVKTLEGENTSLGWSTQKKGTVLYVFTPACHWCKSNLNNIKSLAATQSDGYRFVGLS